MSPTGPARTLKLAALAAAVAMFAAASCGGGGGNGSGAKGLPGSPTALPTFDAQGFRQLLAGLHGKPVVVNIWASWCGPCIFEAPELGTVADAYKGQVQFLGVDIEDQLKPARAFIQKFKWTYPSVFDPDGSIRDSFGLIGAPHTLFFDATGDRTFVWSGPVTQDILVNGIKGALHRVSGSATPSPTGY
jgi:cytochrome c biogenesis protein CcmG, thiol:disulfide interchange protein DsbE